MEKIEVSTTFFKKALLEKLKKASQKLGKADALTYQNDDLFDVWQDIRQSLLIVEELIEELE